MSRKARATAEEKLTWPAARYFVLARGFGPPKPAALIGERASHPNGGELCVLLHAPEDEDERADDGARAAARLRQLHPLLPLAPLAAPLLLAQDDDDDAADAEPPPTLVVVDVSPIAAGGGMAAALDAEGATEAPGALLKPTARALKKLCLRERGAFFERREFRCRISRRVDRLRRRFPSRKARRLRAYHFEQR